jgi:hypothetical protein
MTELENILRRLLSRINQPLSPKMRKQHWCGPASPRARNLGFSGGAEAARSLWAKGVRLSFVYNYYGNVACVLE